VKGSTRKPKITLAKLIGKVSKRKPVSEKDLLYFVEDDQEAFRQALHKALAQSEEHDKIPQYRRVRPSISADELGDLPLFCSHLRDEGSRAVPRPGKRIKEFLPPNTWSVVEKAAKPEWETSLENAKKVKERASFPGGVWDMVEFAIGEKVGEASQLSTEMWKSIQKCAGEEYERIKECLEKEWGEICGTLKTEKVAKEWRTTIAQALSEFLGRRDFYDEAYFKSIRKTDEINELLMGNREDLEMAQVKRLNRLLMEASFPGFLAQSDTRQPSYWQVSEDILFALIEHDVQWLGDPVILRQIEWWQKRMETADNSALRATLRKKLRRIGECLILVKGPGNYGSDEAI